VKIDRKRTERKVEIKIGASGALQLNIYNYPLRHVTGNLTNLIKVARTDFDPLQQKFENSGQAHQIESANLPSPEEIANYIESKGWRMIHASYEIQDKFLGRRLSYPKDEPLGKLMSMRHHKARELIELKYDGFFRSEQRFDPNISGGRYFRIYTFSKNVGVPKGVQESASKVESSKPQEPSSAPSENVTKAPSENVDNRSSESTVDQKLAGPQEQLKIETFNSVKETDKIEEKMGGEKNDSKTTNV